MEDDLSPPTRADSALDTLTAARSAVRPSVLAAADMLGPSRGQLPDQASVSAQPSLSSAAGGSSELVSASWGGAAAGSGGLQSEGSLGTAYGPPMLDNPSETLEEARRLLAASLHAEPSSSSSFSHLGMLGFGVLVVMLLHSCTKDAEVLLAV